MSFLVLTSGIDKVTINSSQIVSIYDARDEDVRVVSTADGETTDVNESLMEIIQALSKSHQVFALEVQ